MNIMTKRGSLDNIVTFEHVCDTMSDLNNIPKEQITLGTTAIVLNDDNGAMAVFMANSKREWSNILESMGGDAGSSLADILHVCGSDEYDATSGKPTIEFPLEGQIYLTPTIDESNNLYAEWIYIDGEWEKFGPDKAIVLEQSDWKQTDNKEASFIKNKPAVAAGVGTSSILLGDTALNKASFAYAIAEGSGTTATGGKGAHAEGTGSTASALAAHAEGMTTTASKQGAHSEGLSTTASGVAAHSEGGNTTASGPESHAEGMATTASGTGAHAEGNGTIAASSFQHVFGTFNAEDSEGQYVEIVGGGMAEGSRENIRTLEWNGNETLKGTLTVGADPTEDMQVATKHYIDSKNILKNAVDGTGSGALAIASTVASRASGQNAVAEATGQASGRNSHAEGWATKATNTATHSEGYFSQATGSYSHAEGSYGAIANITLTGEANATTYTYSPDTAFNAASTANLVINKGGTIYYVSAVDTTNHTVTVASTIDKSNALNEAAATWGSYSLASGAGSHAEGQSAAINSNAHSEGFLTVAQGNYAHAEGYRSSTNAVAAHAEGRNTSAAGEAAHAEGYATYAIGNYSHTEGHTVSAYGIAAHAEGEQNGASGDYSHAEGYQNTAVGKQSHAEGLGVTVNGANAHAEGEYTIASGKDQHVSGKFNIEDAADKYAEIIGNGATASARSNARTLDWSGNEVLAGTLTATDILRKDGKTYVTDADVSNFITLDDLGSAATKDVFSVISETYDGYVPTVRGVREALENKVDKVSGKGLSTEDYTTAEKTTAAAIAADPFEYIAANLNTYNTSGFHNSIFRGKKLGTEVTAAQWAEIKNGTFKDMYIGDYWSIGGTDYVICHFNYYKNCGDANFNKNHILVMPRGLYSLNGYYDLSERPISDTVTIGTSNYGKESTTGFRWNAKYTEPAEEGGEGTWSNYTGLYINSHIYLDVLPAATAKMEDAFGADHVLICKRLLPSASNASTGAATSWAWTGAEQKLHLLNETQVYGQQIWSAHTGYEIGIDKWQLAIFRYYPEFANIRAHWWLRSVSSAAHACYVINYGYGTTGGSANAYGLRPLAILGE